MYATAYLTSLLIWLWHLDFKTEKGDNGIHVILLNHATPYCSN